MADDDLLSLDFTSMVPEPPPAPEPVPAPPVVVEERPELRMVPVDEVIHFDTQKPEPPPAAQVSEPPPFPECIVEAAELHAQGDEIQASRRLEMGVKRGSALGDDEPRVWLALFQQLQLLGRQPAFETLALVYARRFEQSPPAWVPLAPDVADVVPGIAGVTLSGALNSGVGDTLKQLMKLAQTAAEVSVDVSGVSDADNDGCTLLMRALGALKKARKTCLFGSPKHLADLLSAKLPMGHKDHEAMWLLMLELYQQAGHQDAFEEAAVNYAVTFEVSPPSFEVPRLDQAKKSAASVQKPEAAALHGRVLGTQTSLGDALSRLPVVNGEVVIDASGLMRIDEAAANQIKAVLEAMKQDGKSIRVAGLSQLTAVFLTGLGWAKWVTLETRKS